MGREKSQDQKGLVMSWNILLAVVVALLAGLGTAFSWDQQATTIR
jgi:hypothetical protein